MTTTKPLRLWPGIVLAALLLVFKFGLGVIGMGSPVIGFLGGLAGGLLILLWWLFFSRAAWSERLIALAAIAAGLLVTSRIVHVSLAEAGQGRLFFVLAIPFVSVALVAWAAIAHRFPGWTRRASMIAIIFAACGGWMLVRTGGITGDGMSDLHWRWTRTPEERLLARAPEAPAPIQAAPPVPAPAKETVAPKPAPEPITTALTPAKAPVERPAEWPGFRGPGRDAVSHGTRITTDWAASPPVEIWRRPIGPGWSSFAVAGDIFYTQEQRGDDEIVAAYKVSTGEPVWHHRDNARFWESNGGPGPRGTPTLARGRVFSLGATGILNALDAATGAVVWSRNAAADSGVEDPGWGFASSPLVIDDLVIVATSGRLAAYDAATGNRRWLGPTGGNGYSSPHLVTIGGVPQILLLRGSRTISVAPADGTLLWEHRWDPGVGIVQPASISDSDVLIVDADSMGGLGMRRLALARGSGGWTAQERWTSKGLKPYFNDFVVHKGYAFGFDGSILACIDLADGARKWKGGRYGHGQMLLLPEQDLLLVLSEEGEIALVSATPDRFSEVAKFKAIEGKTWNHPVLVRDVLLVRNGEEMAAFRLARADR
jgi:outer membrane protein assembly factor BamB